MCRDLYNRNIAKPVVRKREIEPRTVPAMNPVVFPEELLSGDDEDGEIVKPVALIISVVVLDELLFGDDGDEEIIKPVALIISAVVLDELLSGDIRGVEMARSTEELSLLEDFVSKNAVAVLAAVKGMEDDTISPLSKKTPFPLSQHACPIVPFPQQ